MENLIPFILFVIVGILSAIGKMRKVKKKKNTDVRKPRGLTGRIQAWLTDLRQRIETQSRKAPKGQFDWEQLIGRSGLKTAETTAHDDAFEDMDLDTVQETPSPRPNATPLVTPPPPHMPSQPPEKPDMMAVDPPRMSVKGRRKTITNVLPTSRSDLRQAVVWSEILGPPIALRDPFRQNR